VEEGMPNSPKLTSDQAVAVVLKMAKTLSNLSHRQKKAIAVVEEDIWMMEMDRECPVDPKDKLFFALCVSIMDLVKFDDIRDQLACQGLVELAAKEDGEDIAQVVADCAYHEAYGLIKRRSDIYELIVMNIAEEVARRAALRKKN
jgi:hypothetical protein